MKVKVKQKGSMLIAAIITTILYIFISSSFVVIATGGAGMIGASRVALQAQQYAEIDADILKNIDYEELDIYGVKARQAMTNVFEPNWEHEITIAAEALIPSGDAKQRIATIHIYKKDDTLPRFTLEVPLTSQGSGDNLPIGTILAYNGDVTQIPKNWHLCDGTDGTPDLTGRFLQGWGWDDFYTRHTGEYVTAGLPNIFGNFGFESLVSGHTGTPAFSGAFSWHSVHYRGSLIGGVSHVENHDVSFNAQQCSLLYGKSATVQPRAYVVYYIIKLK